MMPWELCAPWLAASLLSPLSLLYGRMNHPNMLGMNMCASHHFQPSYLLWTHAWSEVPPRPSGNMRSNSRGSSNWRSEDYAFCHFFRICVFSVF